MAEVMAVPLMQCPLLFKAGICNFFRVPGIARLLFTKDTVRSLTSTNEYWPMGRPIYRPSERRHTHWWITLGWQYIVGLGFKPPVRQLISECGLLNCHLALYNFKRSVTNRDAETTLPPEDRFGGLAVFYCLICGLAPPAILAISLSRAPPKSHTSLASTNIG